MAESKNNARSISSLEDNAKNGNVLAMFQLSTYYNEGEYTKKDYSKSDEHLLKTHKHLSEHPPTLKSLSLYNFKCFKDEIKIDFHQKITVIIGKNGSGKTSIAETIAKGFSWLNNNLRKDNVSGVHIKEDERNVNTKDYTEVTFNLQTEKEEKGNEISFSISKKVDGYEGPIISNVEQAKAFGKAYRTVLSKYPSQEIPLFAYYSVETRNNTKGWKKQPNTLDNQKAHTQFMAIDGATEAGADSEKFYTHFIRLSDLSEAEKKSENVLRTELNKLNELLEKQRENTIIQEEIKNTQEKIKTETEKQKITKKLNRLVESIEKLIDDIKNIKVHRDESGTSIQVGTSSGEIHIAQLSHGQKALIALVGDLFFRLLELNPHLENPLNSHGIVVVDEIELHLHPKWQQNVLITLQEIFPNIQWIITTHSPQILSTVNKESIRQLSLDHEQIFVETPAFQTKGVSSIDVLEQIMGTHSIPKVEEAEWLSEYRQHIANNQWETPEAIALREKIERHFTTEHPEVSALCSEIEFKKLKNRLKTKKAE